MHLPQQVSARPLQAGFRVISDRVGTFSLLREALSILRWASFRHLQEHFATPIQDREIWPIAMDYAYRKLQCSSLDEIENEPSS
ncbi:hypothetical protein CSW63_17065 [Caulobacter sp. FWC26]|nr:hypothetical protein CSW63_17065 [Caulobacter sp. FWC26]